MYLGASFKSKSIGINNHLEVGGEEEGECELAGEVEEENKEKPKTNGGKNRPGIQTRHVSEIYLIAFL